MQKAPVTCLVFATLLEAEPFIKGLSLARVQARPFPVYRRRGTAAVISGIGKANSAMAAAYACMLFSPASLVNLGAAGATSGALPLGANLQVSLAVEYDRPGLRSKAPHEHAPDTLKGFPLAAVATLDRPTLRAAERRRVSGKTQLADMEAAAFIQACRKFGKKCYVFKFVTDTPGHESGSDIVANIKKYRGRFFRFFRDSVADRLR